MTQQKYAPREWFSVIYKSTGKKKCDCGLELTAMDIVAMNPHELTYIRSNNHLMGQIIDVTPPPALPTNDIVVNMDGGVGGSWEEVEYIEVEGQKLPLRQLPPNCQEPFMPNFHD